MSGTTKRPSLPDRDNSRAPNNKATSKATTHDKRRAAEREAVSAGLSMAVSDSVVPSSLPAVARQPGQPAPLSERALGRLSGMLAAGATLEGARKALGIKPAHWRALRREDSEFKAAVAEGQDQDHAAVLSAIRKAALTAKGTLRKGNRSLHAARFYLDHLKSRRTPDPDAFQGGVLVVYRDPPGHEQTMEQFEAELAAQQDHLQKHAQLVHLDRTGPYVTDDSRAIEADFTHVNALPKPDTEDHKP